MDSTVFIVGFGFFTASFILLAWVFIYYVYSGYRKIHQYSPEEWEIKWNKSLWFYLSFLVIIMLFMILYMAQYLGQGFAPRPNMMIVAYLRWVIITITGGIMIGSLAYVMFRKPHGGQSFFTVLLYIMAIVFLLPASLSQSGGTRLLWIICSMASFAGTMILFFFPVNKVTGRDYNAMKESILDDNVCDNSSNNDDKVVKIWQFNYKLLYMIHIIIIYIAYLLIWFLSDINEFTTAITFEASMIAYLCFDLLSVLPFVLILGIMTFRHRMRKLELTKRGTDQKLYVNGAYRQ